MEDVKTYEERKTMVMEGMYKGMTGKLEEVRQSVSKELQFSSAQNASAYESLAGAFKQGVESLLAEFRYLSQQNSAIYDYNQKERTSAKDALLEAVRACTEQIAALGGRPSVTQWKRAGEPFPGADGMPRTDLILTPVTGRTHQLRLHCAHSAGLGAPIEGDPYYSPAGLAAESPETPLLLHAGLLDFEDPASGRRVRFFRAPTFRPDLQERDFDR